MCSVGWKFLCSAAKARMRRDRRDQIDRKDALGHGARDSRTSNDFPLHDLVRMTPSSLLRTSLSRRKTCLYSSILTCARRSLAIPSGNTRLASFESLGIDKTVVRAVQVAFPNIRHPTSAQEEYIRAVLDGKDVLLKGQTGSGKCVSC